MKSFRTRAGGLTARAPLTGLERLEDRDQPAGPLADLNTVGAPAFSPSPSRVARAG